MKSLTLRDYSTELLEQIADTLKSSNSDIYSRIEAAEFNPDRVSQNEFESMMKELIQFFRKEKFTSNVLEDSILRVRIRGVIRKNAGLSY